MTFPRLQPPVPSTSGPPPAWTLGNQPGIAAHFLKLRKPSDVTEDTLALLNVSFEPDCDFETFLSSLSHDAQAHLPPKEWLDPPEHIDLLMGSGAAVPLLSNGRRVPDQKEFHVRARELVFKNEDAFSTLTRKSRRGPVSLRLAHFRKFWEGLDNMAYYWDNTLDEYYQPSVKAAVGNGSETTGPSPAVHTDHHDQGSQGETSLDKASKTGTVSAVPNEEEPRKKAKTEAVSDRAVPQSGNSNGFNGGAMTTQITTSSRILPARAAPPPKLPWATNLAPHDKPIDLSKGSYQGYRIGNGAEMPDQYRIDCVRAFLEPIAWAFGVTLSQHRRPPVLKLEHIRFPVRMSSVAWRGHHDRVKARQGWMQGPILGMQCRADVNFGATGNLNADSVLDTVRELGGLLLLAQERAREGKAEQRSGEGKWWTTKERWGGGPGGEVGDAQGASDAPVKDEVTQPQEKPTHRNPDGSKARRRPTPAEVWKTLKPGHPLWDPKVVYEAIGKDKSAVWDDVRIHTSQNWWAMLADLDPRFSWSPL